MKNVLALALLTAAISFAQPPSGAPALTELRTYLNLSDTQVASINAANSAARTSNRALADQARTKQQALQSSIANGGVDTAAIGKAVLEIAAIRKQLDAAHTKQREQVTSFLSAEQKTKLKALEDAETLRPAIGQAHALSLLAPPAGGPGRRHFGNRPE